MEHPANENAREAAYSAAYENAYVALDEARAAAWAAARSAVKDQYYPPETETPQQLQEALDYARHGEHAPRCALIHRIRRFFGV